MSLASWWETAVRSALTTNGSLLILDNRSLVIFEEVGKQPFVVSDFRRSWKTAVRSALTTNGSLLILDNRSLVIFEEMGK